ncbi:uncharacterized protein Z518_02512 [Rhinocladiella mackenziei CBS 650.93]|uniref:Uncharacterized protein n=1 Tax=Rhinocladiella mackenziei CBS 650.93 TaxID=1442369 RepID=A0A0D2HBP4_9EURO|nr:uncharacterized protein Z518_02512 [Rhinocladiella mackenziei CBS 650.93]KIX07858.1 hypothetical protein Z518_02512 [Rhinocladiella mackenziei CBS 650.93]
MRLQLLIQRHTFPPVQILFTTGTGPASHTKSRDCTIADLLNDVNDLVPLESADGEWGLEDYVVEVAATADQTSTYECLHFQTCEAVLREDDEVIIRALTSEDLRARRLGGRHQISGDGRHLIDGVAFGRQWLKKTNRPGIVIPPRKRRKVLMEEPFAENEEETRQFLSLENNHTGALVPYTGDEDEDDEDYVDETEADDSAPQVSIRGEFDDADADAEDHSGLSAQEMHARGEELSTELKFLLEDAADIARAGSGIESRRILENKLKRKRDLQDDKENYDDDTFEGFSTPVQASTNAAVGDEDSDADTDGVLEEVATQNIVEDDDDDDESGSDATSSSESSSSDSDAESIMAELTIKQAQKRALNLIKDALNDSSNDSESAEDDSTSSSATDSDSDALHDREPDSDTSSSSSSSSSSSESGSEVEKEQNGNLKKPAGATADSSSNLQPPETGLSDSNRASTGVPFSGSRRTHNKNNRAKKRKKLNFLKKQGLLSEDADFQALAAYEQKSQSANASANGIVEQMQDGNGDQVPEAKSEDTEGMADKIANGPSHTDAEASPGESGEQVQDPVPESSTQLDSQTATEPTPKRARLDLASSRRMLFSSLGLRTPKTPEDEQALKEKLAKSARPVKNNRSPSNGTGLNFRPSQTPAEDDESWKNKLVISAVECEQQEGVLTPPPFPFRQGWSKPSNAGFNRNKRAERDRHQSYQDKNDLDQEDDQTAFAPDISSLVAANGQDAVRTNGTKTTPPAGDEESDGIVIPTSFEILPELDRAKVLPGTIIAYKELHVDATTDYQPEISSYRVGRVSHMDADGTIHLQLAKGCVKSASSAKFDKETGKRVYGKFDLEQEDGDDVLDDGAREITFSNMILPRLVEASSVEVPDSNRVNGLGSSDAPARSVDDGDAVIPESAEQKLKPQAPEKLQISVDEITTPRRKEITDMMKEAGFESALDEHLLKTIPNPSDPSDSPWEPPSQSQEEYPHRFRRRSPREGNQPLDKGAVDANITFDSDWSPVSSPIVHPQETVEYPHISQMEINSSGAIQTTNDSSYQDAQKVSPAPAVDDLSFTISEHENPAREEESNSGDINNHEENDEPGQRQNSPAPPESEASPSQPQEAENDESSDRKNSFLGGRGSDGRDSLHHGDGLSGDESDFPSLGEFISSRKPRKATRSPTIKVSPPPTRRSLRHSRKVESRSPSISPPLPPSSQPAIKLSQSQSEPRMAQIPPGTQVIDLTTSSDAASPPKRDRGFSYGRFKTEPRVNGTGKTYPNTAKPAPGVGTRRLLTTKKTRSYY